MQKQQHGFMPAVSAHKKEKPERIIAIKRLPSKMICAGRADTVLIRLIMNMLIRRCDALKSTKGKRAETRWFTLWFRWMFVQISQKKHVNTLICLHGTTARIIRWSRLCMKRNAAHRNTTFTWSWTPSAIWTAKCFTVISEKWMLLPNTFPSTRSGMSG